MLHNRQAPGRDFHKHFSLAPARSDTNPPNHPQSAPAPNPLQDRAQARGPCVRYLRAAAGGVPVRVCVRCSLRGASAMRRAHRGSNPALSARSLSPATRALARWSAARRGDNKDHPRRCGPTSQHAAAGGGPPRATEAAAAEQARLVRSGPPRELRGIAPGGRRGGAPSLHHDLHWSPLRYNCTSPRPFRHTESRTFGSSFLQSCPTHKKHKQVATCLDHNIHMNIQ